MSSFQLSPGVLVTEKDLTSIIPAVSTSTGAFAGVFQWGPVLDPITISSEKVLVQRFGRPNDAVAQSFFTAANFLSYSNNLIVCRVDTLNARNAVAIESGSVNGVTITEGGEGYTEAPVVEFSLPEVEGGIQATGTAVLGEGDDSDVVVSVEITNPGSGYTQAPTVTFVEPEDFDGVVATGESSLTMGVKINNEDQYLTQFANGNGNFGQFAAKYPGTFGNSVGVTMVDAADFTGWAYENEFDSAPGTSEYVNAVGGSNDELHIVVYDSKGLWTGVIGSVLEKFSYVSKASDAKKSDGANNYYKDVLNNQSRYVWWMDHPYDVDNWGSQAEGTTFDALLAAIDAELSGGVDDHTATDGQLMTAFELFANDELYDISLVPVGKASAVVADFVISNVVEYRKDCLAFISPENVDSGDIIIGSGSDVVDDINEYRNELPSTSYAVLDSGYKYQYDRYNDKYRWVPLNGDIAGLCARTDYTNDPWWSPGGLNRGQIKNVVKLAVNPGKTERDNLYKNGVNSVVSFPGQGVVLFGDKTLLSKPSAFDRINVRRLFIVLEKAIATAAKYQLFEFNDSFTRAQFKNMVEPFLRDVQGRRGVIDFRVKCDDTNNTGEVIDRNEFVADIFIKPNRSINFITLNFIAARTSVNFNEIGA